MRTSEAVHAAPLPDGTADRVREAQRQILAARSAARLESGAAAAAANHAMAAAARRQLEVAGIATDSLEAAAARGRSAVLERMAPHQQPRRRSALRASAPESPSAFGPQPVPGAPAGAETATLTPPFWVSALASPPDVPAFLNATPSGELNYFVDARAHGPISATVEATQGVLLWPDVGGRLAGVPGFASVGARSSVDLVGHAGCAFLGGARAQGSLGWQILEFDEHADVVGTMIAPTGLGFDIAVNWGETQLPPPISAASFTQSFAFITQPNRFYAVSVLLSGAVSASGDDQLTGSWAAIYADVFVQSISYAWWPLA